VNSIAILLYRLGKTLAQAFAIVVIVFVFARFIPGDVVDVMNLQGDLTEAQSEAIRANLGLDRSIVAQFMDWSSGALRGDFGRSIRFDKPVSEMLLAAIPTTLTLAGCSFLLGIVISFALAIAAVTFRHPVFKGMVDFLNVWSISLPTFCVGVLAILVFSIWLRWVPFLGNLLFPILVIGIDKAGQIVKPLYGELSES